jgi:hypothetical protein
MLEQNLFTDINFWNFDCLIPRSKLRINGRVDFLNLNGNRIIKKIAQLSDRHIVIQSLNPQTIETIHPNKFTISSVLSWDDEEQISDMSVIGNSIYIIDKLKNIIVKFINNTEKIHFYFDNIEFSSSDKFCVQNFNSILNPFCYVLLQKSREIVYAIMSESKINKKIVFRNAIFLDDYLLGKEIYFCIDNRNKSFLISDTDNHRVIEINIDTKKIMNTFGKGKPGQSLEGANATEALLNKPRGIDLYRHNDIINVNYISEPSLEFLRSSPNGIRPRTIVIADSGNNSVKRIIDFHVDHKKPQFSNRFEIFTLLGSGESPPTQTVTQKDRQNENLNKIRIHKPIDISISSLGELVLFTENYRYIIALRPASALADHMKFEIGKNLEYESS